MDFKKLNLEDLEMIDLGKLNLEDLEMIDFRKLNLEDLDFFLTIYSHDIKNLNLEDKISKANDLLNKLKQNSQSLYPYPIVDLYISSLIAENDIKYNVNELYKLTEKKQETFAKLLYLDVNEKNFSERLFRILEFSDLIASNPSEKTLLNSNQSITREPFVVKDLSIIVGPKDKDIASGSYGKVYSSELNYAVKKFYDHFDEDLINRPTLIEISILRYLKHPNIISPVAFQFAPIKLAMPLADCTLKDCNSFIINDKKNIFYQIFQGISYCHNQGVWHLDIKPANILLFRQNNGWIVKIADFGMGTFYPQIGKNSAEVVTLYWRPPEILLGDGKYNSKVDIWSIGIMLLELTKEQFSEDNEVAMLKKIFHLFGTPTEKDWPGWTSLYYYNVHEISESEAHIDWNEFDLEESQVLQACLTWPNNRKSADEILSYPYFDSLQEEIKTLIPDVNYQSSTLIEVFLANEITIFENNPLYSKYRHNLFNWAREVSLSFRVSFSSLFYGLKLFDIINTRSVIKENSFVLYLIACLWISFELNEVYGPDISDLIEISNNAYVKKFSKLAIKAVLGKMDFKIIFPTANDYLYEWNKDLNKKIVEKVDKTVFLLYINYEYAKTYSSYQLAQIASEILGINNEHFEVKLYNEDIRDYLVDLVNRDDFRDKYEHRKDEFEFLKEYLT